MEGECTRFCEWPGTGVLYVPPRVSSSPDLKRRTTIPTLCQPNSLTCSHCQSTAGGRVTCCRSCSDDIRDYTYLQSKRSNVRYDPCWIKGLVIRACAPASSTTVPQYLLYGKTILRCLQPGEKAAQPAQRRKKSSHRPRGAALD